jgi:hypothetical protein
MSLISNSNFRNSQNYILWKKDKYIVSNDKEKLYNISFLSYLIISPIILLFFWIIGLFIKEFYKLKTYWLDNYWLLFWIIWFLIWLFISAKVYNFLISRKKYILLKKIIRFYDKENYYDNFIFVELNSNKKFKIIKLSQFLAKTFYSIILWIVWYIFFLILIILPISILLWLFIEKQYFNFLNSLIFNLILVMIFSTVSYYLFTKNNEK